MQKTGGLVPVPIMPLAERTFASHLWNLELRGRELTVASIYWDYYIGFSFQRKDETEEDIVAQLEAGLEAATEQILLGERAIKRQPSRPKIGGLVPLPDAPFVNEAGTITNLVHGGCTGTVSVLECLPGTTRSRHAHRTDSHTLFVAQGKMLYFERDIGSKEEPPAIAVEEGQAVYTPPMRMHKCYFPVRTILVSISAKSRTHEEHEKDVIREDWP